MAKYKRKQRPPKPAITELRPDQHFVPRISPENQKLVGRAIIIWSKFEAAMQDLIWELLHLNMADGRAITARLDARFKIGILWKLAERNIADETDRKAFLSALDDAEYRLDDRNFIAHANFGTLMPDNVLFGMSLRPESDDPDRIVSETFPESRMLETVADIEAAITVFSRLQQKLAALRGK